MQDIVSPKDKSIPVTSVTNVTRFSSHKKSPKQLILEKIRNHPGFLPAQYRKKVMEEDRIEISKTNTRQICSRLRQKGLVFVDENHHYYPLPDGGSGGLGVVKIQNLYLSFFAPIREKIEDGVLTFSGGGKVTVIFGKTHGRITAHFSKGGGFSLEEWLEARAKFLEYVEGFGFNPPERITVSRFDIFKDHRLRKWAKKLVYFEWEAFNDFIFKIYSKENVVRNERVILNYNQEELFSYLKGDCLPTFPEHLERKINTAHRNIYSVITCGNEQVIKQLNSIEFKLERQNQAPNIIKLLRTADLRPKFKFKS